MAAYLTLTDINSNQHTPNKGSKDKDHPIKADADSSDQYVDFLTLIGLNAAHATGIKNHLDTNSIGPGVLNQGNDLESLHYSLQNHDDGKFTMEQKFNRDGGRLTKNFIGVTNYTGFFQMTSLELNETLSGQIHMDKATIEFISTIPAYEAPETAASISDSDPYEVESCNAYTLARISQKQSFYPSILSDKNLLINNKGMVAIFSRKSL